MSGNGHHTHAITVPDPNRLSGLFIGLMCDHLKECKLHGPQSMQSEHTAACMRCQAFICKQCHAQERFFQSVMEVNGEAHGRAWSCQIIQQGDRFAAKHLHAEASIV